MNLNLRGYYLGVKYFSKQAANNVMDGSVVVSSQFMVLLVHYFQTLLIKFQNMELWA